MKAEFVPNGRRDKVLLIADSEEEAEDLRRWDNSIVSTRFDHENYDKYSKPKLLLVKER